MAGHGRCGSSTWNNTIFTRVFLPECSSYLEQMKEQMFVFSVTGVQSHGEAAGAAGPSSDRPKVPTAAALAALALAAAVISDAGTKSCSSSDYSGC